MKNIIMSRPRDSVFVLFPSADSLTPAELCTRYGSIQTAPAHPYVPYPPQQPQQPQQQQKQQGQDESSADATAAAGAAAVVDPAHPVLTNPFKNLHNLDDLVDDKLAFLFPTIYNTVKERKALRAAAEAAGTPLPNTTSTFTGTSHPKPLVIVLDSTWTGAKTLDRRLTLIMSSVFKHNLYNEQQLLQQTDPTATAVEPKQYLHRVRVTRAMRNDIGQLRRLQGSERTALTTAGMDFSSTNSLMCDGQGVGKLGEETSAPAAATTTDGQDQPQPTTPAEEPQPATTTTTKGGKNNTKVMLQDDDELEDASGGKVNTLHAYMVLLEEMFDLPTITSHNKLIDADGAYFNTLRGTIQTPPTDSSTEGAAITTPPFNDTNIKLTALDVVKHFTQLLSAVVIGYHTERGLARAQLLDAATRQIVKEKYSSYLEKKDEQKKLTLEKKNQQRALRQQQVDSAMGDAVAAELVEDGEQTPQKVVKKARQEGHTGEDGDEEVQLSKD